MLSKSEQLVSSLQLEKVIGTLPIGIVYLLFVSDTTEFKTEQRDITDNMYMFKQQQLEQIDKQYGIMPVTASQIQSKEM